VKNNTFSRKGRKVYTQSTQRSGRLSIYDLKRLHDLRKKAFAEAAKIPAAAADAQQTYRKVPY
jgi:hypothetical protein